MLKNTINKLFFKKKKKKESKQQFECYQKEIVSAESDHELRGAKRFISNYRQKILNDESTQVSLSSLKKNLKEYRLYIDDVQARRQIEGNRQQKCGKSYIGKLFNLRNAKKEDHDKLRTYLNNPNKHLNTHSNLFNSPDNRLTNSPDARLNTQPNIHLNTHTHTNRQFVQQIKELKSKRMLNQRIELDNYFKQNFCNCKNRHFIQAKEEADLRLIKSDEIERLNDELRNVSFEYDEKADSTLSDDVLEDEPNIVESSRYELDSDEFADESYTSYRRQRTYSKDEDTKKSSSLDLGYMEDSLNELDYSSDREDDEDDQYLDTYTIESANTEDNPISTDNYTRLIKKLTYSDTMRHRLLELCDQQSALEFEEEFSDEHYPTILNLDSGTFAVTFLALDNEQNLVVLKVIRTISKDVQSRLNQLTYSGTETFDEVYGEVMISRALSSLHHSDSNTAHCFPKILFTKLMRGRIPDNFNIIKIRDSKPDRASTLDQFYDILNTNRLIQRTRSGILNDRKKFLKQEPFKLFPEAPIEYTVIAMKYVGKPLWKRLLNQQLTAQQLFSVAQQLIFGLACAEQQFNFEHRDLHISNILIKRTKKAEVDFVINNQVYKLSTYGYRCFVVDMTFSRLTIDNQVFYKDLSAVLHKRHDLENVKKMKMQDMVYQLMRDEIGESWHKFRPRTNIHWLIYVLKTIKSCELFRKNSDMTSQLLVDYANHANQCCDLIELINYIVERSSQDRS